MGINYTVSVKKLVKKFGDFTAVDGLTFNVKDGEIFGLLGPNGAGKTTTIKMLTTILPSTSGNAEVAGYDMKKDQNNVRKNIGIIFQDPSLDDDLTGKENLEFHAILYKIPKERREKKIAEVLKLVELEDKADTVVRFYSGGMKRRLEIARGLVHEPKILFLDEPTVGLDPQTRRHIWEYIKKLNVISKTTIILTTHYIEEADYLCDRVAIVDHGKLIQLDTPKALKDKLGGDVISIETKDAVAVEEAFKGQRWVKHISKREGVIDLTVMEGEKRIPEIVIAAEKRKVGVGSISLRKPSLEDVFIHFTGKTIREEEGSSIDAMRAHRRAWTSRR